MKKSLHKRIQKALEEEEAVPGDLDFVDLMRQLAAEDSDYFDWPPQVRNAVNAFFVEMRDTFLKEVMAGNYGVQILLDTFLVMSFEIGYKLHKERGDL